jgi:hypothetical protein
VAGRHAGRHTSQWTGQRKGIRYELTPKTLFPDCSQAATLKREVGIASNIVGCTGIRDQGERHVPLPVESEGSQ